MKSKKEPQTPMWIANLRRLMAERGYNPRSLSLRAGLNATAVRDMIEGRSRFPRYDTVQALAQALETTPARLMSDEANQTASFDNDVELLTEIIARLQETAADMGRSLTPREFAAMSATVYKKVQESPAGGTRESRISAIRPQIHDLMQYEALRTKKGR